MATVRLLDDSDATPAVRAVFDEIREARGTDYVNNFWRALAHDPEELARVWAEARSVMAAGALDPMVKELVYIAVSTANACPYCVHSHTAAARAKGMTEEQHAELLRVIALAARTNHLVTALQVPVDPIFDQSAQT